MTADILSLLKEPLEEARARLGISPPLAYRKALAVMADRGWAANEALDKTNRDAQAA